MFYNFRDKQVVSEKILQYKIYIIALVLLVLCFFGFMAFKPETKVSNDVSVFAAQIIEEYRLKNDYGGLYKQYKNFVAGDMSGEPLQFGSKSFNIVAQNVAKKDCFMLLSSNAQKDLSLISVIVNGQEFFWGKGLPFEAKSIRDLCLKNNKIVWIY